MLKILLQIIKDDIYFRRDRGVGGFIYFRGI